MRWKIHNRQIISPGSAVALLSALIILLSLVQARVAQAWEVTADRYALSDRFEYLEDPVGALGINHILLDPGQYRFLPSAESKPGVVFGPVWLKLSLSFAEDVQGKHFVLASRADNYSDIRIYRPDAQGHYEEVVTGNNYIASTREVATPRYVFNVAASPEPTVIYLRYVGGAGTEALPWYLIERDTFEKGSEQYFLFDVACYAAILALLLFNAILAGALRKAAYVFYSAFVVSFFLALLTYEGLGFYYLWPNLPQLNDRAMHVLNNLSACFRILAVIYFLDIAKCAPGWYRASLGVIAMLAVSLLVVGLVGSSNLPAYAATVPWLIASVFGFAVCIVGIVKQQPLALPLFITLLVPALSLVVQGLFPFSGHEAELYSRQLTKIGLVLHAILWSACLAAQIKHQAESHRIALHDNLTGLPQAALLRERFEWAAGLARRQKWRIAVLFVDLDGFKAVNDSLGHAAGDRVLLEAAARMRHALRKTDYVARLGGDEFVVLLIDVPDRKSIETVTRRLLGALAQPMTHGAEVSVRVSASIGVSVYDGEEREFPELLREADLAMYAAKKRGKNTCCFAGDAAQLHLAAPHLTLVTG